MGVPFNVSSRTSIKSLLGVQLEPMGRAIGLNAVSAVCVCVCLEGQMPNGLWWAFRPHPTTHTVASSAADRDSNGHCVCVVYCGRGWGCGRRTARLKSAEILSLSLSYGNLFIAASYSKISASICACAKRGGALLQSPSLGSSSVSMVFSMEAKWQQKVA